MEEKNRFTNGLTHEELVEVAKPLLDILYKYFDPHHTIIIAQDHVEVVGGVMASPLPLRD